MAKKKTATEIAQAAVQAESDIDRVLELRSAKASAAHWRAQYNSVAEKLGIRESELSVMAGLGEPAPIAPHITPAKPGTAAAIIVLSDWHAEEDVDPRTVNGLNEYNLDIFGERCDRAFSGAVKMLEVARGLSEIDEVIVAVLGDLINGYIHPEMEESNLQGPTEAMLTVKDRLSGGIDYLASNIDCSRFRVCCCFGNHGRITDKPRVATAHRTNLEWLLYRMMGDWARENYDGLEWEVADGQHLYVDVKGHTVRLHHGDGIRYQGGVGGVTIPLNKAIAAWNDGHRADLDILGHWHQFERHERAVLCGSLVGHNAYAIKIKARYQRPSQALVVVDKEEGMVFAEKIHVEG